ncbi:MAG: Hsp70 family protein [Hyphomonadaceae bacterium]|nr:Hsp70 family protein [Hyphomonadaceae bacterium]
MAGESGRASAARMCIDFGTALSKVSICLDPDLPLPMGVRPLAIGAVAGADHPLLTPSVIFVDGGRLYFGPVAFEHARNGIDADRDPLLSFKTVLGAKDVSAALAARIERSIDPTGTLRQRDALVLYLAYLEQLIAEAVRRSDNLPPAVITAPRRYTSPVWRAGGGVDRALEVIFAEAAAVSVKLGQLLLSPDGISIAQCTDALDKAAANPGNALLETGVFEPHAAAATALAFSKAPTRFVVVFDMGAGTTDLAAFDFNETTEPPSLTEITEARQCSALAGDEVDRILIEALLKKRGARESSVEEARFLRASRLAARDLKREIFTTGRCSLKEGWRTTSLHISELLTDPNFRGFQHALGLAIGESLGVVAARAAAARADVIDVVLAGGGSQLPFLVDLVHGTAQARSGGIPLRVEPLSPTSPLYDGIDTYFNDVFPQLAMSIGGALVEMLPPSR